MEGVNHEQRATRAWEVLCLVANKSNLITYGQLAEEIGIHHRAIGHVLHLIQDYCLVTKLPPLTILVVQKASGIPGDGFIAWDVDNVEEGLKKVYEFNWELEDNPFSYTSLGDTQSDLVNKLLQNPVASEEIYLKVKSRGVVQKIFRDSLLEAYDGQCCFCGFPYEEALQAAHIKPWTISSPSERLDIRNGLLLCANHHLLFDNGILELDPDLIIKYECDLVDDPDSEIKRVQNLNDEGIFLPNNEEYYPLSKYIEERKDFYND